MRLQLEPHESLRPGPREPIAHTHTHAHAQLCDAQDLLEAKKLEPGDKAIAAEYARIRKMRQDLEKKEASMYAKMFGSDS